MKLRPLQAKQHFPPRRRAHLIKETFDFKVVLFYKYLLISTVESCFCCYTRLYTNLCSITKKLNENDDFKSNEREHAILAQFT